MNAITQRAEGTAPGDGHSYPMPLPRLRLTPDVSHGPLDGAWWPRCDALELELPVLVGSLDPGIGTVTRVTVETAAWPDAPQEVMAPGHVVEVVLTDSAAEAHAITLDCGTVGSWELLVIPTEEPARVATRLLTAAADPANPLSAPCLPALAESGPDGQDTWESEGGAGPGKQPVRLRTTGGPGMHDRMMEPWHRQILCHPGPPPPLASPRKVRECQQGNARTGPRASGKLFSERSSTARTNCRPTSSGPWSPT